MPDIHAPVLDRAVAAALRDTAHCPDCGAPLAGASCVRCGADLAGPAAARLLDVSLQAADLLEARAGLRAGLHSPVPSAAAAPRRTQPGGAEPGRPERGRPEARRPEAPAVTVQQVLLSLGASLLAIAALVFTVVAWGGMGIAGRAAVLVAVTVLAGGGTALALRRGLSATAEALAAVTAVLYLLDAYAARRTGLAGLDRVSGDLYWGALLGAGGVLALLLSRRGRLVAPQLAGAAAAVTSVPLLAGQVDGAAGVGVLLAGAGALATLARWAIVAIEPARRAIVRENGAVPEPRAARGVLAVGAVTWWLVGATAAAIGTAERTAAPAVALSALELVSAAVLAWAAGAVLVGHTRAHEGIAAHGAAAACAPALAVALAARGLDDRWLPLVALGAATLLWYAAATRLAPLAVRAGTRATVVVTVLVAAAVPAMLAVASAGVPFLDLGSAAAPASRADSAWARVADVTTAPTVAAPLTLLAAAALLTVMFRAAHHAASRAGAPTAWAHVARGAAAAAAAGALVLLPVSVGLRTELAAALLVTAAAALLVARGRTGDVGDAVAAAVVLAVGLGWAGADDALLLACLLVTALATGAATSAWPASWRPYAAAATSLAAAGAAASAGATVGMSAPWSADLSLLAVGIAAVVARSLTAPRVRGAVQSSAAVAALVSLVVAAPHEPALSLGLTLAGTAASLVSLERDRAWLRPLAAVLLAAASWSRLHGAGVDVVEAYTLPSALALLVGGALTARHRPVRSWTAYGPGLCLGLLPSLVTALAHSEDSATRPLLVAAAAAAVTVAGARTRLAAPLLIGAGVLLVDALAQVGPVVAALPRWVVVGALGALLVVLGSTYERRLHEVRALTERLQSLR